MSSFRTEDPADVLNALAGFTFIVPGKGRRLGFKRRSEKIILEDLDEGTFPLMKISHYVDEFDEKRYEVVIEHLEYAWTKGYFRTWSLDNLELIGLILGHIRRHLGIAYMSNADIDLGRCINEQLNSQLLSEEERAEIARRRALI